jgi:hypothetical protein
MTQESKRLTKADLDQFTGTEHWYRHPLACNVLYTDGARYVAQAGGAYWLLDEIALTQQFIAAVAAEGFQLWKLTLRDDHSALLACEDGNGREVFSKAIEYTDFPLPEIKLYFTNGVILLPSEY